MNLAAGVLINALRLEPNEHSVSIFSEGLWGFPDNERNRSRWGTIVPGKKVLIYGEHRDEKGVWMMGRILERLESHQPVKYWTPPTGFPLQIRMELETPKPSAERLDPGELDSITPISRAELSSAFGIRAFRALQDRWSLYVFGDKGERGVTYPHSKFEEIWSEFVARNPKIKAPERPDHEQVKELIYQIGLMQGKHPEKEHPLEDRRMDIIWRRVRVGNPYLAWEVQLSRDGLFRALAKLKHAFDVWNAMPVLVTTQDLVLEAERWVQGSFHEVADRFRILTWQKIKQYYEAKRSVKDLEGELRIM